MTPLEARVCDLIQNQGVTVEHRNPVPPGLLARQIVREVRNAVIEEAGETFKTLLYGGFAREDHEHEEVLLRG